MKSKQLLILLGVLVLLVVLVLASGRKPKPKIEPLFPDLQSDQIAQIEINKDESQTLLKKEAGQWLVATQDSYPADAEAVEKLLSKTIDFKKTLLESKNAKFHEKYGVDASGTGVKLSGADETLLAHFYVGRSETDYMNTYVRQEGKDSVYRIAEPASSNFDKGTRGWRDRAIFKFDDYEISKLSISTEDEQYVLDADRSAEEVVWSLNSPEASPAKKDVVERMANSLSALQTDEFPESQDLDVSVTGLDAPASKVEATLTDGTTRVLLIGKKQEEDSKHYVQRADKETVFILNEWRVNQLIKKLEDIKEEVPEESAQEPVEVPEGESDVATPEEGASDE